MTTRSMKSPWLATPVQAAVIAVLAGAPAAFAQTPAPAAAPAAAAASAPETQTAADGSQRVVVTATKRATFVQDTPLAVTAISGADLERANIKDITTLQQSIPNLRVEQHGDSGGVHVFLRGVGSTNHTELGDPAVAFHVDGVYSPRPQGATVLMYDLASVEVARGPQGTLFGRNATAGSINLITAKPRLGQFSGSGQITVGDRHRLGTQAVLNAPLGDTLALRVAAATDKQDGWVGFQPRSNVLPGAAKYGATDQVGVRTTLLWEPVDQLTATAAVEYFRDSGSGQVLLMQQPREGQKWNSALIDTPGVLDQDVTTGRLRVDWRPTDAMEVSYIGSVSRLERQNASDYDAGTQPGFKQEHRTEWSRFQNQTHELNVKSTGDSPLQWIAGLFYIKEDNRIRFDIDISQTPVPAGNGPIVIHPVNPTDVAWAMSFIQPKRTLDSKAAFGQFTYAFTPAVKLTAGARYTIDKKADVGGRNWVCPDFGATVGNGGHLIGAGGPVDPVSCASAYAPATWNNATGGANDGAIEDKAWTYLLRGEWQVNRDLLTYANVSTGFKSGGLSDGGRRHKPEFLTNYEFGAKSEFFNRAMALNIAAFFMKYKDMQVSSVEYTGDPNSPGGRQQQLVTSNAARATIKGLEAELSWRITRDTRVMGNASVLEAKYDEFLTCDSALLDCSLPQNVRNLEGNRLRHAPRFSTTVAVEHDFALGNGRLTPRAQVHYQTTEYLSEFNDAPSSTQVPGSFTEARTQKGYATVDLSLRYEDAQSRWYGEAFVLNAGDKQVKTDAVWSPGSVWTAFYNPPRTFGVKAGYRF